MGKGNKREKARDEDEVDEDSTINELVNGKSIKHNNNNNNNKKRMRMSEKAAKKEEGEEEEEEDDKPSNNNNNNNNNISSSSSSSSCSCFPMSRIKRIIKSEEGSSSIHISQDSVFLINKASEKFLELFSKEAYACANKKKQIEYKHLSSVVSKLKRFDFLSDFVPEKVQAGIALAEISSAET